MSAYLSLAGLPSTLHSARLQAMTVCAAVRVKGIVSADSVLAHGREAMEKKAAGFSVQNDKRSFGHFIL